MKSLSDILIQFKHHFKLPASSSPYMYMIITICCPGGPGDVQRRRWWSWWWWNANYWFHHNWRNTWHPTWEEQGAQVAYCRGLIQEQEHEDKEQCKPKLWNGKTVKYIKGNIKPIEGWFRYFHKILFSFQSQHQLHSEALKATVEQSNCHNDHHYAQNSHDQPDQSDSSDRNFHYPKPKLFSGK